MPIEITTQDFDLAKELQHSVPEGVAVAFRHKMVRSDHGRDLAVIIFSMAANVPVNLFSNWLYDTIKNKTCRISHRGKQIAIDEVAISRAVSDDLEIGKND